jgi:MFS family permease
LLVCIAIILVTAFAGMAVVDAWWGVGIGFAIGLSRGLSTVILADGLNRRLNAEFRATVNSLVSLGSRTAFILVGPLLGLVVDVYGVETALLALAVLFAPVLIIVLMILFNGINNENSALEREVDSGLGHEIG